LTGPFYRRIACRYARRDAPRWGVSRGEMANALEFIRKYALATARAEPFRQHYRFLQASLLSPSAQTDARLSLFDGATRHHFARYAMTRFPHAQTANIAYTRHASAEAHYAIASRAEARGETSRSSACTAAAPRFGALPRRLHHATLSRVQALLPSYHRVLPRFNQALTGGLIKEPPRRI
jgi:hypothetical protein